MRSLLVTALLVLGPAAAHAQNSNQSLRQQLNEVPLSRQEVPFELCIEIADDYAHYAPNGFQVETNSSDTYTVRIFDRGNRVLRITCYQNQMFQETWVQRRR